MKRRSMTGAALLVVAGTLLTGCGSDSDGTTSDGAETGTSRSASPTPTAADGTLHEVTLRVEGQGRVPVMYHADSSGSAEQTLPWRKTESIRLTDAERRTGYLVSVVPGSIKSVDGAVRQAPCFIEVDGRSVVDNDGGKNPKGCSYKIK